MGGGDDEKKTEPRGSRRMMLAVLTEEWQVRSPLLCLTLRRRGKVLTGNQCNVDIAQIKLRLRV